MNTTRPSGSDLAVLLIGVVMLLAFTFPVFGVANRVEPIVLGMPFAMFWIATWIVLGAIALFVVYLRDARKDDR